MVRHVTRTMNDGQPLGVRVRIRVRVRVRVMVRHVPFNLVKGQG